MRLVALTDPSPIQRPVDEIGPEDDTDVVELEALRGVDAADLVDPPRRARPEVRLRDPGRQAARLALAFQGIDQSPTLTSGTSAPASSGSDHGQQKPATSRAVAPSPALRPDQLLELADRADDAEVELVVHRPQDLRRPLELEGVVDPLDE